MSHKIQKKICVSWLENHCNTKNQETIQQMENHKLGIIEGEKLNFCRIIFSLLFGLITTSFTIAIFAQDTSSALIKLNTDDGKKIPLILIHGSHEAKKDDVLTSPGVSWKNFINQFIRDIQPNGLSDKYTVYLFQYYSDVDNVQTIANELGRALDRQLLNRPRVILAHSMGGLVAKYFMTYYIHEKGEWRGKKGGETTLGLITLATPHHGTPGANDPNALMKFFPLPAWETGIKSTNFLYYNFSSVGFLEPSAISSTAPNRSDLRWDNYDQKLDSDTNAELLGTNQNFKKYSDKTILYAGILKPLKPYTIKPVDSHSKLSFADGMLFYGLGEKFGYTDGLVPFKSALLCDSDNSAFLPGQRFVCTTPFRVRRFEFGTMPESLPDKRTLSITRNARGFDHEDMRDDPAVLRYVRIDLLEFAKRTSIINSPLDIKSGEIWKNSLGMEFVQIPAGNFKMGSNLEDGEKPVHNVTLTKDFQIGKYEVIQSQWRAVMGTFPSRCEYPYKLFTGDNLPIICVTYNEIEDFIRRMNGRKEGIYRLPTEAEWEYAARAGNGDDIIADLFGVGWIDENSGGVLHPVGQKPPNGFGLYDMYGNVWEWCQDYYDNSYYQKSPKTNPLKSSGYSRVTRGGSWYNPSKFARPAARGLMQADSRVNWQGFRLVRQS